ncbi:hypothetical protein [Actinomadura sp. 3N508]|uniref:hypothetical protein n=1 Tax=Actinomadura sp. 3N508 TaxID=3375153 RepID=UPI003795A10D
MSYDIYFLKREPGQSWEEALEALEEEQADATEIPARPPNWDQVVAGMRELLGEVSVLENPPSWEIDHEPTAIQVSCFSGEWSISVPYWSDGDAARRIAERIRRACEIVQAGTGLQAYDPQVEEAVLSEAWTAERAALIFDQVATSFAERGIIRGSVTD